MGETTTIPNDFYGNTEDSLLGNTYNGTVNTTDTVYDQYPDNYRPETNGSLSYYDLNYEYEYTEFVYEAFGFERLIYLYVWVPMVIVTVLVNILVIWVLLQKKMRTKTNILLVAIAISDSMTGLVTLPTYIMVYRKVETGSSQEQVNGTDYDHVYYDQYEQNPFNASEYGNSHQAMPIEAKDAYILSKPLCDAFMISMFFLSQSFHTISIWLTSFLGIQRYTAVAYPFKTHIWFTPTKIALVIALIFVFAPVLHLYHLVNEKSVDGFCTWLLKDKTGAAYAQIWITLFLRHLIPCFVLIITTVLFIRHLNKNSFRSTGSEQSTNNEGMSAQNGRVSRTVMAIMILFLIPEVPYGLFLLYMSIIGQLDDSSLNDLNRNRAIRAGYEIALVLSFHLNFYIYTFFNKRFRLHLLKTFGIFASCLNRLRLSTGVSGVTGRTRGGATKNESLSNTQDSKGTEMKAMNRSSDSQGDTNIQSLSPFPNDEF